MTTQQIASVITDAIRQAAADCGIPPKRIHDPHNQDRHAVAGRNRAIQLAHSQGVTKRDLAEAFVRTSKTIAAAILRA